MPALFFIVFFLNLDCVLNAFRPKIYSTAYATTFLEVENNATSTVEIFPNINIESICTRQIKDG